MGSRKLNPKKRRVKEYELSDKEIKFCHAYVAHEANLTAAARAIGYANPGVSGDKLLKKPAVRKYIGNLLAEQLKQYDLTSERIIDALATSLFLDPDELYAEDGSVKPMHEIPPRIRRCITKFKHRRKVLRDGDGVETGVEDHHEVELLSREQALILAMKYRNLIQPDTSTTNVSVNIIEAAIQEAEQDRSNVIDSRVIESKVVKE